VYDYGVTLTGVNIKRLDVILDEIHGDLSESWGVNARQNPQSLLNVLLTDFSDKIAELWEFGQGIYDSTRPYSAEGLSLDNAAQFGGISREDERPTYYPIHAECTDGTVIPKGAMIKSDTNPAVTFYAGTDTEVTRNAFNRAKVRVSTVQPGDIYSVALDGSLYQYTSGADVSEAKILAGLLAAVSDPGFSVEVSERLLLIDSVDAQKVHVMTLSGNLTTESVTGIVTFASEDVGAIVLPNGTITQITTAVPGLISVVNLSGHILGRLRETDAELRKSYIDKIFARSNRMIESIKSAILSNVQGVTSISGYQNDTNAIDAYGRWPHCVEMVVDGGDDYEIAQQIWGKKTDGIQTFGSVEVAIPGDEGEPVTIRFNRPAYLYMWFRITITISQREPLPTNYVEAIKAIILSRMEAIDPGTQIIPQRFDSFIYSQVPGIAYIDIETATTPDSAVIPADYEKGEVPTTPRQKAVSDVNRIEVLLNA
jgi:uncharacterized phage protein gp47/JayE